MTDSGMQPLHAFHRVVLGQKGTFGGGSSTGSRADGVTEGMHGREGGLVHGDAQRQLFWCHDETVHGG